MWLSVDCCNRVDTETQATLLRTWQKRSGIDKAKILWDYLWTDLVHKSVTLHGSQPSALHPVRSVPTSAEARESELTDSEGSDWVFPEVHTQSLAGKPLVAPHQRAARRSCSHNNLCTSAPCLSLWSSPYGGHKASTPSGVQEEGCL